MRRWIKVRMSDTQLQHDAADIVEWWKGEYAAATNIAKAIKLYYALLRGDTSLLKDYFPLLNISTGSEPRFNAAKPPRPSGGTIEYVEKTSDEYADDLLSSLGL